MKRWPLFIAHYLFIAALIGAFGAPFGCGGGSAADNAGVGAQCAASSDCDDSQTCLDFKGGYCGVRDCVDDADCPDGSLCVLHTDGVQYCFLECEDKSECNVNRSADDEANCSSNITFVESHPNTKACVPPSA